MSMLDTIISRADEVTLSHIVTSPVLRLLARLDDSLTSLEFLKDFVRHIKLDHDLLRDINQRNLILDLLRPSEANDLCGFLNCIITDDVYEDLKNLRFTKNSRRERDLFSFFGVDPPIEENTPDSGPTHQSLDPVYSLFEHQRVAVNKVEYFLSQPYPQNRVLLHMPTGSGKTRTAMHAICNHLRKNRSTVVVWLAHNEELCEQAAREFGEAWRQLGDRPVNLYRFWDNHNPVIDEIDDGLVVSGLAKMYSNVINNAADVTKLGSRTSLVIFDEAHQAIAPTYALTADMLTLRKASLLGLSATPGRTWNEIDQDQALADFFNRQKVILEIDGFDNPVNYLIDEGYLAIPGFSPLFFNTGIDPSREDLRAIEDGLEIPNRILVRLSQNEQRNLAIINRVETLVRNHNRVLVFAINVAHSELLAAVLTARGIRSSSITGETPTGDRRSIIENYRRSDDSEPYVLCNYGVLTTGFDAPNTSAGLIARPTKSLILYSQMIGRIIRGPKVGGNQRAEVITVVDRELPGFGDQAEAFMNWEDVWND